MATHRIDKISAVVKRRARAEFLYRREVRETSKASRDTVGELLAAKVELADAQGLHARQLDAIAATLQDLADDHTISPMEAIGHIGDILNLEYRDPHPRI